MVVFVPITTSGIPNSLYGSAITANSITTQNFMGDMEQDPPDCSGNSSLLLIIIITIITIVVLVAITEAYSTVRSMIRGSKDSVSSSFVFAVCCIVFFIFMLPLLHCLYVRNTS